MSIIDGNKVSIGDIVKAVGLLQIAYRKDFTEEQMELYVQRLSMLHPATVKAAILCLVDKNKFLPTIAEIKEECAKISDAVHGEKAISADEAWSMALHAAGTYGYERGLETLQENVKTVAKRFWHEICYDNVGNIPLMRAHFMKAYTAEEELRKETKRVWAAIAGSPELLKAKKRAAALQEKVRELAEAKTMR